MLTRNQQIILPETNAIEALERALALDQTEDVLERNVAALDMHNTRHPTLQLSGNAINELHQIRALKRRASTQ